MKRKIIAQLKKPPNLNFSILRAQPANRFANRLKSIRKRFEFCTSGIT